MGLGRLPDFDAERPPEVAGLTLLNQVLKGPPPADLKLASVELPFGHRSRSRLRIEARWLSHGDGPQTPGGAPAEVVLAGVVLPRGHVLRGGCWVAGGGMAVQVLAADEDLLEVRTEPGHPEAGLALMRAAYHLGNRHVAMELAPSVLKIEYDPVLSDMLAGMGLRVLRRYGPFEPEWGAYAHGH